MNQTQRCAGSNGTEQRPVYRPAVDIVDGPSEVVVWADVPGVDETHLDVTLDKNVLTIRGTVEPTTFEGFPPYQTEYGVGNFERTFTRVGRRQPRRHRSQRQRRRVAAQAAEDGAVGAAEDQRRRAIRCRQLGANIGPE